MPASMTGLTLAQYRIESELGRGGMGIVYRATDTKLNRTVAIKILPPAALGSEDDRARFFREAQAAAQLHHPNIATVFGIDEAVPHADGVEPAPGGEQRPFIAMEFIEGETLHDRIRKGPLRLPEAVSIAVQVAEALKAAHAKNIVHRDIKSANVMLTTDGVAKVLDFGLAKTNQSTMLTRMGSTLGTVAYMSPEQARGQEVDGRSDLYSLGTVLYEMIAGRLPFAGDYEQAIVYGILNEPPEPLTALRTGVPMELERIVGKLLTKEADYRYQGAADLIADLKSLDVSGSGHSRRSMPPMAGTVVAAAPKASLPRWVWPTVAAAALVVGASAAWRLKTLPPEPRDVSQHFVLDASADDLPLNRGLRYMDVAANGSVLVYESRLGVMLRRAADMSVSQQAWAFDDDTGFSTPIVSPDGEWIAFDGEVEPRSLMRVRLNGEPPRRVTELPGAVRGGIWGKDGYIYLGFGRFGIGRVAENGGPLEMLIPEDRLDGDLIFESPVPMPSGRWIVAAATVAGSGWTEGRIIWLDAQSGEWTTLFEGGSEPRFVSGRWIVYGRAGMLYARAFDGASPASLGDEVPVASETMSASAGTTGAVMYAVTDAGTLFKIRGSGTDGQLGGNLLSWSEGAESRPVRPDQGDFYVPRIQPGGRLVVVQDRWFGPSSSLIVLDGVTGNEVHRVANAQMPVWSRDGQRLAYGSGSYVLSRSLSDFERVDTLVRADTRVDPTDWSPDGRYLLYNYEAGGGMAESSIRYLDLETGENNAYLSVDLDLDYGRFSPDGKWVVYEWGPVGSSRAAIRRFPGGENEVFASGGEHAQKPVFGPGGRHVYFADGAGIARTEFDPATGRTGATERVLPVRLATFEAFDVDLVTGRLLVVPLPRVAGAEDGRAYGQTIDVIVNWTADFPQPK